MNNGRIKKSTLFILLLAILFSAGAQQDKNNRILHIENSLIPVNEQGPDSLNPQSVLSRMKALGIPGVSIAVFDQGHIIWARGYGLSDKESSRSVDSATVFQAASISKPVTSVAMFRLVEKKLIKPDSDINLQLHSWKVPGNEYTKEEKVTPARIVSHMAGLTVHGFYGYNPTDTIPTLRQILDGAPPANSEPVRVYVKPGTEESYSGGGFVILQLLMEEVMRKPFSVLMNDLVLRPGGMTKSFFTLKSPAGKVKHFAKGYHTNGEMVDGGYHVYPEQAAAGLWTTASDLARFMLNVGDSWRGNSPGGILQQATVRQMLTRVPGGSGSGFGIDGKGESFRFRHNGGNEGFSCYAVSFAETGRGVVIMTNSDNGDPLIRELARAIAKEYHWPPMLPGE